MEPGARNWVRFWNRMLLALFVGWFLYFLFAIAKPPAFQPYWFPQDGGALLGFLLVPPLLVWLLGHLVLWAARGLRD